MNHKIAYKSFLSPSQPVIERFLSSLRNVLRFHDYHRRIGIISQSFKRSQCTFQFHTGLGYKMKIIFRKFRLPEDEAIKLPFPAEVPSSLCGVPAYHLIVVSVVGVARLEAHGGQSEAQLLGRDATEG